LSSAAWRDVPPECRPYQHDRSKVPATNAPSGEVATAMQDRMHEVVDNWRRHGFDVEMTDLWCAGDRHDVAQYLNGHGWATSEPKMNDSFTANRFTAPTPAENDAPDFDSFTYVSATRR
jgi:O-methyltransferase involved in polyketide biosynthesis